MLKMLSQPSRRSTTSAEFGWDVFVLFWGAGRKSRRRKLAFLTATSPSGPTDPLEVLRATSLELKTDVQTTAEEDIEAHTRPPSKMKLSSRISGVRVLQCRTDRTRLMSLKHALRSAIALWDGWARDGCSTDGGPLQGMNPAVGSTPWCPLEDGGVFSRRSHENMMCRPRSTRARSVRRFRGDGTSLLSIR